MDLNYDAGAFNGPKGNDVPATGTYNIWAVENVFYFVPNQKVVGGNLGFMIMYPIIATGSLVADIKNLPIPNLQVFDSPILAPLVAVLASRTSGFNPSSWGGT